VDTDIYVKSDLSKDLPKSIHKEMKQAKKILCFHLAGQMFTGDAGSMMNNNLTASSCLFLSLVPYRDKTVVVNVGSSAEYGYQGKKRISERAVPEPVSLYGFCKLFQTQLAQYFSSSYGLPVVMTRTFNLIGPGQTDKLVFGNLVKRVRQYKTGSEKEISMGHLGAYRDFIDVRDAVRAYVSLAEKGVPGEAYNVASGRAMQVKKGVGIVLDEAGVDADVVRENPSASGSDIPYQNASIAKIRKKTGWVPEYSFEKSIKDMIRYEWER